MVRTTQPRIERAKEVLDEEARVVECERVAFQRFLARIREMGGTSQATVESNPAGGPAVATMWESTPSEGLRAVRTAYRETVMAVPHYDREYGDTLGDSMAAELGETLAGHVSNGQVLTPRLYDTLCAASERARDDRGDFLRHLDQERESLREVGAELNEIESRLAELARRVDDAPRSTHLGQLDETLAGLERQCTDLANRRQATIHGRSVRKIAGLEGASLLQYLYASRIETVTPVLSDVAACLETIRHQRKRCLR
jgi:hypothetical protein